VARHLLVPMGLGSRNLPTALLLSYPSRAVGRPFHQCNACAKDMSFKCQEFAFAEFQRFREFVNFARPLLNS